MNYFLDFLFALPVLYALSRGFRQGFVSNVISLFLLIFAIYFSTVAAIEVGNFFNAVMDFDKKTTSTFTFLLLLLSFAFGIHTLMRYSRTNLIQESPGYASKTVGALIAGVRWALIVSCLVVCFNQSFPFSKETKKESYLVEKTLLVSPFIYPFLEFKKPEIPNTEQKNPQAKIPAADSTKVNN